VSELSDMKPNLVDRTCELLNDCATTESYTRKLIESSYVNIPSKHSSDVVKWSSRGEKDMIFCEPTACMRVIMDARHSKAFSSNQSRQ